LTDDGQTDAAARDADFERFCEEITMASVGETVAKLLTHPFGFLLQFRALHGRQVHQRRRDGARRPARRSPG
jgi:hypothetical protein